MEGFIDLHTHSTASDGSMAPRELVRHAKEIGLSAIALTDHDTVDGVEDALDEGKSLGIEVIAGLEIGVDFKPEMHILGYYFDDGYKKIRDTLVRLRKNREERNPKIINRLKELGYNISMDEVLREAGGNVIGRPHMAAVLVNKGYFKSVGEVFEKLLASGKPAYFKKDKLSPEEGLKEISCSGGIPVLAHPIYLDMNFNRLDELLSGLAAKGLKGIEAYYVDNSADDTGNLLRLAIKHNLAVTGGSDFHGSFKQEIGLGKGRGGLKVPYDLINKLRKAGIGSGIT